MIKITRREFVSGGVASVVAMVSSKLFTKPITGQEETKDLAKVVLGKTDIKVSRLAFGSGTRAWDQVSEQTRLGKEKLVDLFQYAYDAGITFFDCADIYGTHTYLRQALKYIPREKVIISTKIWPKPLSWKPKVNIMDDLDRFRKEIDTDYIDAVMLHCMMKTDWPQEFIRLREDLSSAKDKGIIRAHGCTCHSLSALRAAAKSPWVEVVYARINNTGVNMDDKPEVILPVIREIHDFNKGVVGMKIFGCGKLIEEQQRKTSLKYVFNSNCVDAITIGFVSKAQIDDTLQKIGDILN